MSWRQRGENWGAPADQDSSDVPPPAMPEVAAVSRPTPVPHATRTQRFALIIGLLVAFWLALQLFGSVLAPFVAATVLAYALDPAATALNRLGLSRGFSAILMILAVLLGV